MTPYQRVVGLIIALCVAIRLIFPVTYQSCTYSLPPENPILPSLPGMGTALGSQCFSVNNWRETLVQISIMVVLGVGAFFFIPFRPSKRN